MKAGILKHRITLQKPAPAAQDPDTGDIVAAWETAAQVWAQIVPVSVREFLQAAAVQNEISLRAVIRANRTALQTTTDWRMIYNAEIYEIKGIMPDPDTGREYLTLVCTKVV